MGSWLGGCRDQCEGLTAKYQLCVGGNSSSRETEGDRKYVGNFIPCEYIYTMRGGKCEYMVVVGILEVWRDGREREHPGDPSPRTV